jgi:hypothetical protein
VPHSKPSFGLEWAELQYDLPERMPEENTSNREGNAQPKRGLLLRLLYRVYTNYLGVTPPTPAQERVTAVVLIGGVVLGLIAIVLVVFFLWQTMMKMGR